MNPLLALTIWDGRKVADVGCIVTIGDLKPHNAVLKYLNICLDAAAAALVNWDQGHEVDATPIDEHNRLRRLSGYGALVDMRPGRAAR